MTPDPSPSLYLAGPGVFRRDAEAYGAALKTRCLELGLTPLWPLDNQPTSSDPAALAREIREMNCAMIRDAAAVIADISPFRGPNMDPGTAFEIGYAVALDKPVFLYSTAAGTLFDRAAVAFDLREAGGKSFDPDDLEVEDFGLCENLMIATVTDRIYASFEEALDACASSVRKASG
jgi:nucleoside 2-deoxyribosyltransferase